MVPAVSPNVTAAVVDGSSVLLTPVQRMLIPPPMCAVAAVFPGAVQCLAFGEHQGREVGLLCTLNCSSAHCLGALRMTSRGNLGGGNLEFGCRLEPCVCSVTRVRGVEMVKVYL